LAVEGIERRKMQRSDSNQHTPYYLQRSPWHGWNQLRVGSWQRAPLMG